MPVIRDPDFIDYGEYDVNSPPIDPYTASKNNPGQPAQLLIDYDDRKFVLTAPKYGEIGAGNTNLVGYGGTGGVTGQALYSKFKQIWKEDNIAVKFPFPMEAITPESFEFINGWEPDDSTELDYFTTQGITTTAAITRKLIKDCGWAERTTVADGNSIKRKYFGIITLGEIALPTEEDGSTIANATIYCSQLNPATNFVFNGTNVAAGFVSVTSPMVDMYTGSRVVYQEPTSTPVGFGLTHNNFYFIRFESDNNKTGARSGERHGTVGVTTDFRIQFHPTLTDALNNTNKITLIEGQSGIASIRHQSEAPNFFFDITEEGGAANEPFLYEFSAGAPDYQTLYEYDNYFKIYNREKARTYAEQAISQVGVTQINYQAYRIPLATTIDSNLQSAGVDISDETLGNPSGDTYSGIGVSFHQTPVTYEVNGVPYQFNVTIEANQKSISAVYQYVQGLLRTPNRTTDPTNAGIAYTSMNSLSAVGFGTDDRGARNEYGNDLRVGVTEEPLLEFIGNTLYAKLRNDIYSETGGAANHGVYIKNVSSGQLTDVVYYDNTGNTRTEPFVSSYDLVFNTNLNSDNDARFWIFFDTDETLPGITTTFSLTDAGVVGSTDGIDATNDQFVSGNTTGFHPFVNGQEVVAIATVSDPGIGITCDTLAAGIVTYTIDNETNVAFELVSLPSPPDYGNQSYEIGANNPTFYVYGGDTVEFDTNASGADHPFQIKIGNPFIEGEYQTGSAGALGPVATAQEVDGKQVEATGIASVFNNGGVGIITMTVPLTYDPIVKYYYIGENHETMRGEIKILDKRQDSAFKYYVNARKANGDAQTYEDIVETGDSPDVVGVGSTSTFRLHRTYLDAVANGNVGINTIDIQVSTTDTGEVTFTQTDINYQENHATIVQASDKQFAYDDGQGNVGSAQTYARPFLYMDGIDVPSNGSFNFTFAYDGNEQRNRSKSTDASAKIVTIGLEGAQFLSQDFPIREEKNITVNITAALERVYNDPTI